MRRLFISGLLLANLTIGCRTTTEDPASAVLEDSGEVVSKPFASGKSGTLNWEVRFNLPPCDHSAQGQKAGAWCTVTDINQAIELNGVEARLESWTKDPKVKSIQMAFFSFSNKNVRKALCDAAVSRGLKVTLYIHQSNFNHPNVEDLKSCSPNTQVVKRGTTFGSGYLQHAKIVLASESENPMPISEGGSPDGRTYLSSSSANMSSFGTSLHFENWMFYDDHNDTFHVQANHCFFSALKNMKSEDRVDFAEKYAACRNGIASTERPDFKFYVVPHNKKNPQPFPAMREEMDAAKESIKVAIHRLTTTTVTNVLTKKAKQGLKVHTIFDDDTLRSGVKNGGAALDVGANDVKSYRALRDNGVNVTFMETNADSTTHLFHNKFIVIDDKVVFNGAGNFTSASLNTFGLGNMEQFYIIKIPELVQAYSKGWDTLNSRSTKAKDHPVGSQPEKGIKCNGGLCDFTF